MRGGVNGQYLLFPEARREVKSPVVQQGPHHGWSSCKLGWDGSEGVPRWEQRPENGRVMRICECGKTGWWTKGMEQNETAWVCV